MVSFIPRVTGPQAVVWADRAASISLSWEAEAQLLLPIEFDADVAGHLLGRERGPRQEGDEQRG